MISIARINTIVLIHTIELCTLLKSLHRPSLVFDQFLQANLKNNDKLWNNEHKSCSKTIPYKIVHYSAIYCVNLCRISFRRFELFTIKRVKMHFNTYFIHTQLRLKVSSVKWQKNKCVGSLYVYPEYKCEVFIPFPNVSVWSAKIFSYFVHSSTKNRLIVEVLRFET